MDGKRADTHYIGDLQCASQGIQEQPGSDSAALPFTMDGKTRQDQKGYGMARHSFYNPLRSIGVPDFTGDNCVKPDNRIAAQTDVGLR